jgi:sucrose-6F-phosphate phosphohydrolase
VSHSKFKICILGKILAYHKTNEGYAMNQNSLLASDMDGTVIPLESGKEREDEIRYFNRLIEKYRHIILAYVTGRHLELGLEGVTKFKLPEPDIFVCDVGTTIYFKNDSIWEVDQDYRSELKDAWNGHTGLDIALMLENIPAIREQEPQRQKEFKQSYYVPRTIDDRDIVNKIILQLEEFGLQANVVYSVDTIKNLGLIDVLPEIAAKDYALKHLWQKLQLEFDKVVYAGDSGNDLLAFVSGFNAIIVNNTADIVKNEVRRQVPEKILEHRIYFSEAKYVQGVIEGCFHFQLFD